MQTKKHLEKLLIKHGKTGVFAYNNEKGRFEVEINGVLFKRLSLARSYLERKS